MYITQCALAFLSLYAGLVHSFSWEIVANTLSGLEFYDINGTLTYKEEFESNYINTITYDPVHNRVLFTDTRNIYSFKIDSKSKETLVTITNSIVTCLAYDPVTELLFWNENAKGVYSISLKHGYDSRVNEKQLILSENYFMDMSIDICGGYIHWMSIDSNLQRARFDGSDKEVLTDFVSQDFINIDQKTQKMYWYEGPFISSTPWGSIKCADLNGKNTREVYQVLRPHHVIESQQLTFSKDHIYWKICDFVNVNCSIWKIPKNTPSDIDILIRSNLFTERNDTFDIWTIAAKYSIEDLIGVQNCERVKSLTNVSTGGSLHCVHGTKVSGESRCECSQGYSGERCDVSV